MDLNQTAPLLLFGAVVVILVGVVVYRNIQARKRTAALQLIAPQLGFSFSGAEQDRHPSTPDLATALFDRGSRRKFSNVLIGNYSGLAASVFDYRYTTGGGKNSRTWNQTVIAFSQELWLPEFELRPESFVDRIVDHITHKDIDFDSFPDFSGTDPVSANASRRCKMAHRRRLGHVNHLPIRPHDSSGRRFL
jgi:hypothetical protein